MPVTEGRGKGFKLAGLLTGVTCGIGTQKRGDGHNGKVVLAEHATLYLDKPQTKQLEALGFVLTVKNQQSTKDVLKVYLANRDDSENLTNLDNFRTGAAYEYAKKIMMSCTWTNESTGTSETMNFRINDKQLTSYERARMALLIYEYADGTMTMGQDAPATRDDLYRYQKDRKIALAPIAMPWPVRLCRPCDKTYIYIHKRIISDPYT